MPNVTTTNPMTVDTTGTLLQDLAKVKRVHVKPSAGSWVVTLSDKNGDTVLDVVGSTADSADYDIDKTFYGLSADTLTNITNIQIFV